MACRKKTYATLELARIGLSELQSGPWKPSKKGRKLRSAYHCPECGLYHLTTQTKKQRRRILAWRQQHRHNGFSIDDIARDFARRNGWNTEHDTL